jgi:glutamate racemase
MNQRPIAVFDSGLGGLSVVRHLRHLLPGEEIVYFGDTARVPYGTKSSPTVTNFALEDARYLQRFDPKLLVVACNTASALALDALVQDSPVPVVGVVAPGAQAAARLAQDGTIVVLGTEATIQSGAYPAAIRALAPEAQVIPIACPLFVPLVEEGRDGDDPIVRLTVATYLAPLRGAAVRVVVLGCTHYPLLRETIAAELPAGVHIVDSGRETSLTVREFLRRDGSLSDGASAGSMRFYVSDNPERMRRVGARFLREALEQVEFVAPEQYISGALECSAD